MSHPTLSFSCALITGGAGGIGRGMAEWLLSEGKKVIIAGRTESKLKQTSSDLKGIPYYTLDTGDVASIPKIVKQILEEHPELDCLINNAGVQRPLKFPELDLQKADNEIDINIRGPMHLAVALLPHLQKQKNATIVNVTSILGFVPFSVINPVYNGTKAFMHFHTMNMRTQLRGTSIRVVEIVPPTVATDLHRERDDPDDNKKAKNAEALELSEFIEQIAEGFKNDQDTVSAGIGKKIVEQWYSTYGQMYSERGEGK